MRDFRVLADGPFPLRTLGLVATLVASAAHALPLPRRAPHRGCLPAASKQSRPCLRARRSSGTRLRDQVSDVLVSELGHHARLEPGHVEPPVVRARGSEPRRGMPSSVACAYTQSSGTARSRGRSRASTSANVSGALFTILASFVAVAAAIASTSPLRTRGSAARRPLVRCHADSWRHWLRWRAWRSRGGRSLASSSEAAPCGFQVWRGHREAPRFPALYTRFRRRRQRRIARCPHLTEGSCCVLPRRGSSRLTSRLPALEELARDARRWPLPVVQPF